MKLAMAVNYSGDPRNAAVQARALEQAGVDLAWVAELYSFDAVSILGYLAGATERLELMAGILPIYSRTPTLTGMTAAGLDAVSGGRFVLGLGASGPQVIEGWHGVPYDQPLARTREIIEICRKVWRRERVTNDGPLYPLPLPPDQGTGLGKPLKIINHPVRSSIPIYVASLGPKNVEMTAEVADGWLPIFFHPEKAQGVWGEAVAAGTARRSAELGPLEVIAGGTLGSATTPTPPSACATPTDRWWRSTSAGWAPGARTSTTTSSSATATGTRPARSRTPTSTAATRRPPSWYRTSSWRPATSSATRRSSVTASRRSGRRGSPTCRRRRWAPTRPPTPLD